MKVNEEYFKIPEVRTFCMHDQHPKQLQFDRKKMISVLNLKNYLGPITYDNRRILIHYFSWLYDHQTTALANLYAYCRGFAYTGIFLPLGGYDYKGVV